MKKIILAFILGLNSFVFPLCAQAFVAQRIEIQGLQRVSSATVYSYLPVKRGQSITSAKTAEIIRSLYKTGFFESVTLAQQGNTLIINVIERGTIGKLDISGNSFIPTDKLRTVMKSMDIAEGRVYNRAMVERIQQSLLNQYYELGRYNARVNVTATPMSRNRMLVKVEISEGLVAKIRHINIIGNHVFSESTLNKQLTVSTPGVFTFITQKDRYTPEKLEESIENIRNYYLDHGYLKFAVKSTQVAITPDRKSIYLTIVVDEGVPYRVSGVDLTGDLILPREQLMRLIMIKPGDTFSRQRIMDSERAISSALGDIGYINAVITLNPNIDETHKTVFVSIGVKPGKKIYVRHIYFSENTKTNDEVLRREMQQMEGAVVSSGKLDQSKHQMSLLPYIKNVEMSVEPVPDINDQVDIKYKVTEDNAAQATFTVGYSQNFGVQFGLGFNQKNFLGTGKTFGFNATRSRYETFLGMNYTNPYYTPDGISRSVNVSYSHVDPGQGNVSSSYTLNQIDGTVLYDIPVGQEKNVFNRIQLGYGLEDSIVHLEKNPSAQVLSFVQEHGRNFPQLDIITGISRDSRDKAIFPTRGMLHAIGFNAYAPVTGQSLSYFTTSYKGRAYFPITDSFILTGKLQVAYGNSFRGGPLNFPFFKNFYAGGIDSVRGYLGNSLGPRDNLNKPTGGNLLGTTTLALIFPNHISDNFRTSVFVDGGNVWNTFDNRRFRGPSDTPGPTGSGPIRYSAGIEGDWLTMLGLINVSLAKPINPKTGHGKFDDISEIFQFSLGANFG